jgi:chemotaxis protein MotB
MFDSGSARLKPYFEDILLAMADTIKAVPNKISISGHTDAKPYTGTGDFGNWELSANRANAARRALVAGSYPDSQVARVVGYASSALFDRKNPFNPVNRRIDIVVLTKKAQEAIEGSQGAEPAPATAPGDDAAKPVDPNALPPDQQPVPAHELRERLNLFEDAAPKPGGPAKPADLPKQ